MKTSLKLLGMAALMLTACSSENDASLMAPPAIPAPQAAFDATSGVQITSPVTMPSMAPPGAVAAAPPTSQEPSSTALSSGVDHLDEEQKLTYALQLFYGDSGAPAITDFQPLVDRQILAKVPVAPAGKKYVIDLSRLEVRLENL